MPRRVAIEAASESTGKLTDGESSLVGHEEIWVILWKNKDGFRWELEVIDFSGSL